METVQTTRTQKVSQWQLQIAQEVVVRVSVEEIAEFVFDRLLIADHPKLSIDSLRYTQAQYIETKDGKI